jgi:hypothetical protein
MPVHAMGLARIASHYVLAGGNRLKVRGVHATPHSAQVIEFQSLGDRADHELVGVTVREKLLLTAYAELPVTG